MGVTGLWELLEPVGRRVNIEAISNKRLAVGEYDPVGTADGWQPARLGVAPLACMLMPQAAWGCMRLDALGKAIMAGRQTSFDRPEMETDLCTASDVQPET